MSSTEQSYGSVIAECRKYAAADLGLEPPIPEAERVESLRQYQELVDQLGEAARLYELEQAFPR
jgi:hypothetical protein